MAGERAYGSVPQKKRPEYKVSWSLSERTGTVTLTTYTDLYIPPFRGSVKIQKV